MPTRRRSVFPVVILAVVLLGGAGFLVPRSDDFFTLKKNFTLFGKLYEELATGYVDALDAEQLMRTGIDAMLGTLDPYTVFVDEADTEDLAIMTQGRYGGIGLSVGRRAGRLVVLRPLEGYSAFQQGMRTGDVITHVDGAPVGELSIQELSNLLRGEPGSTIRVTVERTGLAQPLHFVLTRSRVQLRNVSYSGFVGEGVGYIRVERFGRDAAREVAESIERLREAGLDGLVLDLRGNPGGLLDEAVALSGLFLPSGSVVVSTRGRAPETERTYRSDGQPLAPDLPLAVLIDGVSASASEIVAGALQDHDRAVIIGEPTFGKGLVQVIRPLPYNTALKLTVARYYLPSDRSIQSFAHTREAHAADAPRRAFRTAAGRTVFEGIGIEPDEAVSLGPVSELEEVLIREAAFFLYADHVTATRGAAGADFDVTDAELRAFRDWLRGQNFSYSTRAERELERLAETLEASGYAAAQQQLAALRSAIERDKEADFERHAPRLRQQLRHEILARTLGEAAHIEATLPIDPAVQHARALLTDPGRYRGILAARN